MRGSRSRSVASSGFGQTAAAVPASERRIDGTLTRVYLMFPNVIIAELSAHITMVVLEPITVSTTSTSSPTRSGRRRRPMASR